MLYRGTRFKNHDFRKEVMLHTLWKLKDWLKRKNIAFYVNFFILFKTSLAALIPEMITIGIPPPGKVQWPA